MALARVTTWSPGDTLTAAALNGEINNVLNNPTALINLTAAGDVCVVTSAGTVGRVAVGSPGQALIVSSSGGSNLPVWSGGGTPVGSVIMYGSTSAPGGWLLCDGASYNQVTQAALYAVIGITYGSTSTGTVFNVPDMRSRSPVGSGQGAGFTNRVLATTGGEETHVLSIAEMPSHTHTMNSNIVPSGATFTAATNDAGAPIGTSATGGGGSHNTMHPFLVMNFIIKT